MSNVKYIGRFAPSPSGPLHFGSVIAALGSYLQAKQQKGLWLVRIEDIDQPRTVPGADTIILKQLEQLGLYWDNEVVYQNQRISLYQDALENLQKSDLVFACSCSRKDIGETPYPGTCRKGMQRQQTSFSYRIKTDNKKIYFKDLIQGEFTQQIETDVGDFVVKRTDGLFAYHLAVVVDDAEQKITEIVRGADLQDSTPRQVYLQNLLGYKIPAYAHLPVAINENGKKISKQHGAEAINLNSPSTILFKALEFLGHSPPIEAIQTEPASLLDWAIKHWQLAKVPKQTEIMIV